MSFAKAVLSGTLTNQPEQRFTPNNHAVSSFHMSVENPVGAGRNSANEPFIVRVTCWRALAETVSNRLAKGDSVLVEGKLIMNSFQTQDGTSKKMFEIEAASIDKLSAPPESILPDLSGTASMTGGAASGNGSSMSSRNMEPSGYGQAATSTAPALSAPPMGEQFEDLMTEDDIPF